MASIHGLRHLERPAQSGRSAHVQARKLIAAVSLLVGVIAAFAGSSLAGTPANIERSRA